MLDARRSQPAAVHVSRTPAPAAAAAAGAASPARGRRRPGASADETVWPRGRTGWTLVLGSYPTAGGRAIAHSAAARAARRGLPQVGVLDSGGFASLHPGYYVVFSGVYSTRAEAEAARRTAQSGGFAGAYTREISR